MQSNIGSLTDIIILLVIIWGHFSYSIAVELRCHYGSESIFKKSIRLKRKQRVTYIYSFINEGSTNKNSEVLNNLLKDIELDGCINKKEQVKMHHFS